MIIQRWDPTKKKKGVAMDNKFKALEEAQDNRETKEKLQTEEKAAADMKDNDEQKKSTKQWVEEIFGVDSEGKSPKENKKGGNQSKEMVEEPPGYPNNMHMEQKQGKDAELLTILDSGSSKSKATQWDEENISTARKLNS